MPFATLTGNSYRIRFALDGRADPASPWSVRVSRPFAVPVGTAHSTGRLAGNVCAGAPQLRCDGTNGTRVDGE